EARYTPGEQPGAQRHDEEGGPRSRCRKQPGAARDATHVTPLEARAQRRADPPDGECSQRGERAPQRPGEQLDPGSEHQSQEDERSAGGEREVERGRAGRRRARQARGEQPGDGEEPERENRIHKGVRSRTLDARASRAVACGHHMPPSFRVSGGRPLKGTIRPAGNKNAALPILAATLLADGPCRIDNVPHIRDVETMLELLAHLGAAVAWTAPNSVEVNTAAAEPRELDPKLSARIRTCRIWLAIWSAWAAGSTGSAAIRSRSRGARRSVRRPSRSAPTTSRSARSSGSRP